jgi:hypothetical protein
VDGVIPLAKTDATAASLQNHWKDRIAHIWSVEDVQLKHNLTDQEAKAVLEKALEELDCTIGLNWDVIDDCADELFPGCNKAEQRGPECGT